MTDALLLIAIIALGATYHRVQEAKNEKWLWLWIVSGIIVSGILLAKVS